MSTARRRATMLVAVALALAACADSRSASPVANDPPTEERTDAAVDTTDDDGGTGTGEDGPVGSLTDSEREELQQDGGVVLAAFELPDGVVVAVGHADGDAVGVELVDVPRGLLQGGSFGGSGELLLPEDACQFQTADGFTVVITDEPGITVTIEGSDGRSAVEEARPVTVGDREIGVTLAEVGHAQDSPVPSVEPGGEC